MKADNQIYYQITLMKDKKLTFINNVYILKLSDNGELQVCYKELNKYCKEKVYSSVGTTISRDDFDSIEIVKMELQETYEARSTIN